MSSPADQFGYDTRGFRGHQDQMERPILSQSSSLSTQDSGTMNSDYSNPFMAPHGQHAYHLQDTTVSGQMLPPVSSHNPEWWPHHAMMPPLDTSIDMMADMGLSQSAGAATSPTIHDEYGTRRTSVASNPEIAGWQEKVRVEVRLVFFPESEEPTTNGAIIEEESTKQSRTASISRAQGQGDYGSPRVAGAEGHSVSGAPSRPQAIAGSVRGAVGSQARYVSTVYDHNVRSFRSYNR